MNLTNLFRTSAVIVTALAAAAVSSSAEPKVRGPFAIQEQGSFAVGGSVVTAPGTFDPIKHGAFNPSTQESAGQTLRGDHACVFYQVPVNARPLPLVMWHGFGQSAKTWETTPGGREGFQNIFLGRNFSVYLVDQPRRGARRAAADAAPAAGRYVHRVAAFVLMKSATIFSSIFSSVRRFRCSHWPMRRSQ